MKKCIYIIGFFFLFNFQACAGAGWYEPSKVTDKFFPDPELENVIPSLQKKGGFTSYKEMMNYLESMVAQHPALLQMEIVGKTQKGKDIPLISINNGSTSGKLDVFFFARVHGDEPAGTESMLYFIYQICNKPDVHQLLDRLNFYIIPMLNIDGGQSNLRRTANNIDLNRDQSKLDTPEAKILHRVAVEIDPHVVVDFHEFQPVRKDFLTLAPDKALSNPWDVMFLYSGNLNVPIALRNAVDNMFLPAMRNILDENEYTHHTYYSSQNSYGRIYFPIGGASPRSTSNAMALKNTISLLIETRGIKLGDTNLRRRLYGGYLSALAIAQTAYTNNQEVLTILTEAQQDRSDIVVRFTPEKIYDYELPFIDLAKNEIITLKVEAHLNYRQTPTQTRSLPDAYYLLPSETKAVAILRNMGVEVTELSEQTTVKVEIHTVTSAVESGSEVAGIYPLTVKVKTNVKSQTFPAGTYKIDTRQKRIRAATVLLEPESSSGFVNFRVISVEKGQEVPVYRFLK